MPVRGGFDLCSSAVTAIRGSSGEFGRSVPFFVVDFSPFLRVDVRCKGSRGKGRFEFVLGGGNVCSGPSG